MRKVLKKMKLLIAIIALISMNLTGCSNKEKDKSISDLERIVKLNIDEKQKFTPIYWKDDSNIIAAKVENEVECGIYNINLESNKVDKINTIENTFFMGWINDNIIPYIHNKNLWIYDAEKNISKEVYDLNSFINEFNPEEKAESNFEIQGKLAYGGLTSNNKYIYLLGTKGNGENCEAHLKIIDSETNKVTERIQKGETFLSGIFYSKLTNKFYGFSVSDKLYCFDFENPQDITEINISPGGHNLNTLVDENGEFAYYSTIETNPKFIKYDVKNNKVSELKVTNLIKVDETSSINISYLGSNLVSCEFFGNKKVNEVNLSNGNCYVGKISEDKINILGKIKIRETDKANFVIHSLVNKNGNKVFNVINYYSSELDQSYEYTIEKMK